MGQLTLSDDVYIFSYPNGGAIYCSETRKEYTIGLDELKLITAIQQSPKWFEDSVVTEMPYARIIAILGQFEKLGILVRNDVILNNHRKRLFSIDLLQYAAFLEGKSFPYEFTSQLILFLPLLLIPIALAIVFLGNLRNPIAEPITNISFLNAFFYIMCFSFLPTLGHEISHAITAKRYGCHIVEVGITLKAIFLCFYVRIVGMGLCSRGEKIHILLSGMLFNMIASAFSLIGAYLFKNHPFIYNIFLFNSSTNFAMVLENSLCLFKLDGHLVFKELIGRCHIGEFFRGFTFYEKLFASAFSLSGGIVVLIALFTQFPYFSLIFNATVIFTCIIVFNGNKISQMYLLFLMEYSVLAGIILICYIVSTDLEYKFLNFIVFYFSVNTCMVWIGSFLYMIPNYFVCKR